LFSSLALHNSVCLLDGGEKHALPARQYMTARRQVSQHPLLLLYGLHFHEDAGDLYVDVRPDSEFERMKVTSETDRPDFLARARAALHPA
jgi:hypothetical protein